MSPKEDDVKLSDSLTADDVIPPIGKAAISPFDDGFEEATQLQQPGDVATAQLLSKSPLHSPGQAPGYKILQPLGSGTYGEVWLAEEERTGIHVAIKFFAHGAGQQWQLMQAEVKQLAQLHGDPGIVHLIDVEPESTPPYYVMAYAQQGSLGGRLEKGPLPLQEALTIFRQVAEALAYVHAKGIRHCDLKPGNVLLDARGRVRVADFGQAHLSSDASPALGTFFYMAPEQADLTYQIPDTRWDVYGLGALMYAMLTGRPPRADSTLRTELASTPELTQRLRRYRESIHQSKPLTAHRAIPGMDRGLAEIIERCLEIDPAKRLPDAGAVLAALAQRERRRRQRPALIFALVAPFLFLALMIAGVSLMFAEAKMEAVAWQKDMDAQTDERNELVAELVAGDISRHLRSRTKQAEEAAGHPALRALVSKPDPAKLTALLESWSLTEQAARPTYAWITARDGTIVAIYPKPPRPLPTTSFQWREWFNGRSELAEGTPAQPLQKAYVSRPFVGKSTQTMMLAVSAPIRDAGNQIVGVLTMTDDFERWAKPIDDKQSFLVILNERGEYLSHEKRDILVTTPGQKPRSVSNHPEYMEAVNKGTSGDIKEPFSDPINKKSCIAHYAPMKSGDLHWTVFIQREHGAIAPAIESLNSKMLRISLAAIIVMGLGIPALWAWLIWMLRREEGITHG